MKKFIVPVLSVCFFISCSSDDAALNTIDATTTDSASDTKITKKNLVTPNNPNNQYDFLGELHVELLNDCEANIYGSTTVTDAIAKVEWAAAGNNSFTAISQGYEGLEPAKVTWVLQNGDDTEAIVDNSQMSDEGKRIMAEFIDMLESIHQLPYSSVYNQIISYENMVANNTILNSADRKTILIATATSRYSIANNGGRKWGRTKFGVTASISSSSVAEAVTLSVTAGLLSDNL